MDTTGFRAGGGNAPFAENSRQVPQGAIKAGYDMRMTNFVTKLGAAAGTALFATGVAAQTAIEDLEIVGAPTDGEMGFQPAATELARDVQWLDGMLLVIITLITLFVTGLLAFVILRYNRRANPTAASFTHNSPLEVAWTIVPVVILVFIGAFSLPVLFKQQEIPEADITIKVTGYQWYWSYEYLDEGVFFESYMIGYGEGNLNEGISAQLAEAGYSDDEFRLATDNAVVVPIGATVVMQVTGADVIHSWTIPAFGVKQDAVPGRLAQLWFAAEREGIYFGQCSELCGKDHAFMPITVKVVSQEVYDAWLAGAQEEFPA
tara:strand:+ start:188 stop:1144 length:957 start_codon:yes stop_codon:yes gene_type:complete